MKRLLISFYLVFLFSSAFSQNEANLWYFGDWAGLDFNSGEPVPIAGFFGSFLKTGNICDSLGDFIISSDGEKIYNRNQEVMQNGQLIDLDEATESTLIVKKPGNNLLYYVFVSNYSDDNSPVYGVYYSIIDMQLDNGLGRVIEKDIPINDAWDATEKIMAVKHENSEDIWIVIRNLSEARYTSFLLTESGLNATGVYSPAIQRDLGYVDGDIDISHDKKRLVAAFTGDGIEIRKPEFEICNFNSNTGQVNLLYTLKVYKSQGMPYSPEGVAFSPNSKLLYLSVTDGTNFHIFQYDLLYYQDSSQFVNSAIEIGTAPSQGLQLARDGKIYCSKHAGNHSEDEYLSVIHSPSKRGTNCYCEENAVHLDFDNQGRTVNMYLPNMLIDYLFRFEWQGRCSAEPFVFQSNFIPEPKTIRWSFGDPDAGADSISTDINPVHYFTHGGEFEVFVNVLYPSGRVEKTSRVVTVTVSPNPDLGPDTLMCKQGEIVLNAGDEDGVYVWSDGTFGVNARQITVSDTGWYWVQVTNNESCSRRDSIFVGLYPPPQIDENNLSIVPTGCGSSNGKILGLLVSGEEPLSFEWFDAGNNTFGTELDLIDLPVGNYFLHILDGNGCNTISEAYTIEDAGDIEISLVEKEDAHCGQNSGSINITALSGDPDNLLFSVDNGISWQTGNPFFIDLPAGNYFIRVKDLSGCESVFENNPLTIENLPGPEVNSVITVPEIDYLQNGEINISATANSGAIYYSIDNGSSFQTDDGLFQNLSAGNYSCVVKDDFGCDTAFTLVVNRTISQLIEAIAGDGNTCIGNAAVVPLKLNNFKDIFKFHVKLTYDTTVLSCDGYINVNPALEANLQASIIPGTDEVIVSWQGDFPVSLDENAVMLELVFGAKKEGLSGIDWAASAGESAFFDKNMDEVSTDYHFGKLRVYLQPEISMANTKKTCEGGEVRTFPFVTGGSGYVNYEWFGPNGFYSTEERITISNIQQNQAGVYTLKVTDTIQCTASFDVNVTVYENPQIAFQDMDTIFANPGFVLEAGSGYEYYLWNTGDTTEAITISQEGDYSVEIQSQQSCKAADTVTILFESEPFWLPNAFTPDGDGLNDVFKPVEKYDFVRTYQLSIFSRWGELMFETSDITKGWDGTYQGKPVPGGSYVYRIVFNAYPDYSEKQSKTGSVVVVR